MAVYKYNLSAVSADINKLNALANKVTGILTIDAQSQGEVIEKVKELASQLNDLQDALNSLIAVTAKATQASLNQMIELDEDFVEITEQSTSTNTLQVEIKDN